MQINWKVRVKNPLFWVQMASAIALPMLAGVGLQWSDMTSWPALWNAAVAAVMNPVVVVAMAVAAWGVINDPTTAGASDSPEAMEYVAPKPQPNILEFFDDEEY